MFENAPVTPSVGPGTIVDGAADGGSGVTFSEINDGSLKNFWDLPTGSTASILTIPIAQFGVTDVWTMLNTIEATKANDISVVFNFGTSANVVSDSVAVKLGDADAASATGQVRNALVCSSGCQESSQVGLTDAVINNVTVVAENINGNASQSFNNCISQNTLAVTTSASSSIGCSGTAYLDDQGFFFNGLSVGAGLTNLNTYLVSVQVKEIATGGGGDGVSAITIDTAAATPEPSTVLLFVAGLGVLGFGRRRKKA
jgi:hypothetical protein